MDIFKRVTANIVIAFGLIMTFLMISTAYANIENVHYLAYFNQGAIYKLNLQDNRLSWVGIAGKDKGQTRNNIILKEANVGPHIKVYQWLEKTGSFVALTLNDQNHQVVCTGQTLDKHIWFWQGKFKRVS